MIGGNNDGITKANLIKSLKNFYSLIKNDKDNNNNEINKKAEKEAEEIIEFLGEDAQSISLNKEDTLKSDFCIKSFFAFKFFLSK